MSWYQNCIFQRSQCWTAKGEVAHCCGLVTPYGLQNPSNPFLEAGVLENHRVKREVWNIGQEASSVKLQALINSPALQPLIS